MAASMLATLYHHVYDALLIFPAAFGLILCEPSTRARHATFATGPGRAVATSCMELSEFRKCS